MWNTKSRFYDELSNGVAVCAYYTPGNLGKTIDNKKKHTGVHLELGQVKETMQGKIKTLTT
jgi:hypothetical protein